MADRRQQRRRGAWGSAGLVSGLTLLSRVLGLVRDALTTNALGRSAALDVFIVAWMLPNMLRRLFGEGALSAALVPELTARREVGGDGAARTLLGGVLGALLATLGSLIVLGVSLAVLLPTATFTSPEASESQGRLFTELFATLFPYALPVCLMATLSGALNVYGRFGPGALAPALLNVFWIGGLVLGLSVAPGDPAAITRITAQALLLGGLAQLVLVGLPLARIGMLPRPRLPRPEDGSRAVYRRMVPTMIGMSALQLNTLVDQGVGYWLVGAGANSSLFLANRLMLFPHALIALPIATVAFPTLARNAHAGEFDSLREHLATALRLTTFFALPAAVGMALVGEDLIGVAFEHGEFGRRDTELTAWTTTALVASLPLVGGAQLLARGYFAIGETRTPARIALRLVLVNAALNITFVTALDLDAPGIALATSLTSSLNLLLLVRGLPETIRPRAQWTGPWLRCAVAACVMAFAVLGVQELWPLLSPLDTGRLDRAIGGLAVPIGLGIAAYLGAHHVLGGRETREAINLIRRRRSSRSDATRREETP